MHSKDLDEPAHLIDCDILLDKQDIQVFFFYFSHENMLHNIEKRPLCHMRKTYVQISMHISVVFSEYSLSVDIYYNIHWFCKWTTKALISLGECPGWSGPALSTNCIKVLSCVAHPMLWVHTCPEMKIYILLGCNNYFTYSYDLIRASFFHHIHSIGSIRLT